MVYDPIRDIDVPSPAASNHPEQLWRTNLTPGSGAYFDPARQDPYGTTPDGAPLYDGRPPAFHPGDALPSPTLMPGMRRSVSVGLRGLLNEDDEQSSRRGSGQSVSSAGGREEDHRPSISRILNSGTNGSNGNGTMTKSTSITSLVSSSPANNMSPRGSFQNADNSGFLTPASTSYRSRSPHPARTSASPGPGQTGLPLDGFSQEYDNADAGPSRRRVSGGQPRPMLPPDTIPRQDYYDPSRVTPGALTPGAHTPGGQSFHLPMRSPSVSVSPRSLPQALPGFPSRPSSASSSNNPFSFQAPPVSLDSPTVPVLPLSEDPNQTSKPRSRQPSVRPRKSSVSVTARTPVPPPPSPPRAPYQPNRLGPPGSMLRPIQPDEITRLRSAAMTNNPLRRRRKKAAPSWSGTPGARGNSLPTETDTSYFPATHTPEPAPSRKVSATRTRESSSASIQPIVTPGAQIIDGRDSRAGSKRKESTQESEQDAQRRKANDGHYVGNSTVASHYNARPEVGIEHREFSPIIGLKKFNNWIKSVLIGKFTHKAVGGKGANVLDIGCGKGGDLNKWKQARIKLYVALDIADMSVEQARGRYTSMHFPPFEAHFFAHDCYAQPISDILPPPLTQRDLYDNVTMQFCMHYAFESPNKARMMMENVSRYLRKGGIFIGTIPDAEMLLARLDEVPEEEPELRFGNSCYYVQFVERHHKGMYGHAYNFYLQDAVDDVPEYIVHWDNFVNLASEYGLRVIYKKAFHEVLAEEQDSRDFGGLLRKMGVINDAGASAMDADQWEAANLYMAFAFEKI